jgi:pyruvate ferredoxin oxidoreductase alpha subunit
MAYKIAEQLKLPAMVNIDGFVLTHTYEPVALPTAKQIKKYLPDYKPSPGQYLDPANPISMGAFASPAYYMEIRQELHNDLVASQKIINSEYKKLQTAITSVIKKKENSVRISNGLIEYYGHQNPEIILVAMGSMVGTLKDTVDDINKKLNFTNSIGVIKIKCFRPFPESDILSIIRDAKYVAVLEKAISLGHTGPLASDLKAIAYNKTKAKIQSFIVGLGGRDVTQEMIKKIITEVKRNDDKIKFIGK